MQSAKRTFLIELRGGSNEVTQEAETLRVLPGTERTALREHSHDDDGEQNCSEQTGRAASCVAAASPLKGKTTLGRSCSGNSSSHTLRWREPRSVHRAWQMKSLFGFRVMGKESLSGLCAFEILLVPLEGLRQVKRNAPEYLFL